MTQSGTERLSAGQLGERIISSLLKNPPRYEFVRTTDLEFLDELGNVSAELLAAKDIATRYIRDSSSPNGGMIQIASQDHLQLHPVKGTHPLMSPFVTSLYAFRKLHHSMRAAHHTAWLRVQAITRMHKRELDAPGQEEEFVKLLVGNCTFVSKFSDVPSGALFVFGKNKPTRMLEAEKYESLKSTGRGVPAYSIDYERNYEGRFVPASTGVSRQMDHKMREQHVLFFFAGGRYRLSQNKVGITSNGQLAFLLETPSAEDVRNKAPIKFLVAPAGCREIPTLGVDTRETLIRQGWREIFISVGGEKHVAIGRLSTKRTGQYPMQLFIGSTWHSTMGQTLRCVATKVEGGDMNGGPYTLWDPCQIVVMLSRTRLPHHTYFVTDKPTETARVLYSTLKKTSVFREYLSQLLDRLCGGAPGSLPVVLDNSASMYRPRDVQVPGDNTGCVYILLSMRDLSTTYIGSTDNLLRRFTQEHNAGRGARQTAPVSLRPWAILAYVTGFNGDRADWMRFETLWIQAKERVMDRDPSTASVEGFVDIARGLVAGFQPKDCGVNNLKLVDCGSIQRVRDLFGIPAPPAHVDAGSLSADHSDPYSSNLSPVDVLQVDGRGDLLAPYLDDEHQRAYQHDEGHDDDTSASGDANYESEEESGDERPQNPADGSDDDENDEDLPKNNAF